MDSNDVPAWNAATPIATSPIDWISRSYASSEEWKKKAKEVFYSVNGESNVARNRVAAIVRDYFLVQSPEPEGVRRWKKGCEEIETLILQPPKITTSNAAYFDWLHVADSLLLACASPSEDQAENKKRDSEYRSVLESFRIRNAVYDLRRKLSHTPEVSDSTLMSELVESHPSIALAHVKEARRLEREGAPNLKPKEPSPPSYVGLFVPIYFR